MAPKETTPTINHQLTHASLHVEWNQAGHPPVETWHLYVGTRVKTEHPDGGFRWDIRNQDMGKETQVAIPLADLPLGRQIYIQVGGITKDGEEIYSDVRSTSVPKHADSEMESHSNIKKLQNVLQSALPTGSHR